jgi:outer membrane protein
MSSCQRRPLNRAGSLIRRTLRWMALAGLGFPTPVYAQVTTLPEAIHAAEAANRTIQIAAIEHQKALRAVETAKTHRFPVLSVTALGSQPLKQLGITLERGSLGVYPFDGPIPAETTTLVSPLRFGFIGYASVAQPLTQQHKVGLGIELAGVAVNATSEQLRAKRQGVVTEVRRLYHGIARAESGRRTLQATVDFLQQLDRETSRQTIQRVTLQADLLAVRAQLVQAEYELLKMEDPIETQKEQLNRLMGRAIDAPLEIDPSSILDGGAISLSQAYAQALASRPEIRLAKVQQRNSELERRLASAERIPDISLSLFAVRTVNYSSTLPNNVSSVGIQGSWDVFDWGRKKKAVQSKQDAVAQAALELQDVEERVRSEVAHHYRRMAEARKALEVAQALQSAHAEALRVMGNRYVQREAVLSDVLKVQTSVTEANHRYLQALMDLATAQADFEKAIGRDQ